MAARGGGRIINISGLAALQTGSTIGSIRNVGVAALTKNLADELAPSGISVVCVHPVVPAPKRLLTLSNGRPRRTASPLTRSSIGWPKSISHVE
jgi:NAD(P)-dependent dehydrogenase (short-subunit alcohol dehydrogenase family)